MGLNLLTQREAEYHGECSIGSIFRQATGRPLAMVVKPYVNLTVFVEVNSPSMWLLGIFRPLTKVSLAKAPSIVLRIVTKSNVSLPEARKFASKS
jgi:hypothetical protein